MPPESGRWKERALEARERKTYPPHSQPWTVTLWVSRVEKSSIEAVADRSDITPAEVIEAALDDWAEAMTVAMRTLRLKKGEAVGSFVLDEDYTA